MRYLVFVLLFCSFYSCNYYEKKKLDSDCIDLLVSNSGELQISKIQTQELTREQIPSLDSILKRSLEGLPKLYPAIKRS